MDTLTAKSLDTEGRCCGRKPMVYKRPPHLFCPRCDAAYNNDGRQIENCAFRAVACGFDAVYPKRTA